MTRRVVLRQRGHDDLRSAFQWYESQRQGLGQAFVRRAVVSRFPYLVFYAVKAQRIDVLAVLHHARSPADWPSR